MTNRPQSDTSDQRPRPRFKSRYGAVFATAGVAIGLGNIWRFPYMMGREGGGAFLVLYLALVFAFGVPLLMCEWALGRHTRRGPWGAYTKIGMLGGKWVSVLLLITITMAASYYGVVVAWVLQESVNLASSAKSPGSFLSYSELTNTFTPQFVFLCITVVLGCAALLLGVQRGIERISSALLPLFFVIFIVVLVRIMMLDGAMQGLRDLWHPDVSRLTWSTAVAALGQAVFSLGLGGMFMVLYGSYMSDSTSIPMAAVGTVAADVSAAMLAGLIVVPAVAIAGANLTSGPGLLFNSLPEAFVAMPSGALIGALFFMAIFLVAMLSLIAAYEAIIAAFLDSTRLSRAQAVGLIGIVQIALALPAYKWGSYIGLSDFIWGTNMQPLGALLGVIAFGWCIKRGAMLAELRRASKLPVPSAIYYWIRYVIPIGMAVIFVFGWLERFELV